MFTSNGISRNEQVVQGNSTVKKINKLLNISETRNEGLQLLNRYLPQCSDEDFLQFCISWMQNCCKPDAVGKKRDYAVTVLSILLKSSSSYQELKKSVSFFITTRYFDFFFKYLVNSHAGWCCTESCLLYYRGACGSYQAALEKQLKSEISKNTKISLVIGRCFALMPCVGGGGNEGINYSKNWNIQFVSFLNTSRSLLNDLFGLEEEFEDGAQESNNNYSQEDKGAEHLAVLLNNYLTVLSCMMLNQYPAPKKVPSDLVFQLICKGLALNSKTLAEQRASNIVFLEKVLPEIQCTLLSLLNALIAICKNQLLPYSHLICKLIKQILECTGSDSASENQKSSVGFRILAYETLCNWLAIARSGSCAEVFSSVIIPNVVNDIKVKEKTVFLKEKKRQSQLKEKEQSIRRSDMGTSSQICHAALKAMQSLLKFSGALLKPEEHKYLQEVVVELITEIQKNSSTDIPGPLAVPKCRAELYSLLLELIYHPCPKWPPPTNYGLRLFKEGLNDPSPEVSAVCSAAVNFATIIIHPQYDNGGFPSSEMPSERKETEVEFQWSNEQEPMEAENAEESEEKALENEKQGSPLDKSYNLMTFDESCEDSEVCSDEDSRNTVKFVKEIAKSNENADQTEKPLAETNQTNDESRIKELTITIEDFAGEISHFSAKEKLDDSGSVKRNTKRKLAESFHQDESNSLKGSSPESLNDGAQPKARYFLRSKTNGSSEESEESAKKTSSPETSKDTSSKSFSKTTPQVLIPKKRPRTRALSKVESNGETETKTPAKSSNEDDDGDEEDIKAAFCDSFID